MEYLDSSIVIVDSIAQVVAAMRDDGPDGAPYYLYGHAIEINRELLAKDRNRNLKYQKYPLVWLRLDTPEETHDGLYHFDLNIGLMVLSKDDHTTSDRYVESFRNKLNPMYQRFLKELRNVNLFSWPGAQDRPPHVKIDRPNWGTQVEQGNIKRKFNDPLDCIEIVNLKINQRIKNC